MCSNIGLFLQTRDSLDLRSRYFICVRCMEFLWLDRFCLLCGSHLYETIELGATHCRHLRLWLLGSSYRRHGLSWPWCWNDSKICTLQVHVLLSPILSLCQSVIFLENLWKLWTISPADCYMFIRCVPIYGVHVFMDTCLLASILDTRNGSRHARLRRWHWIRWKNVSLNLEKHNRWG